MIPISSKTETSILGDISADPVEYVKPRRLSFEASISASVNSENDLSLEKTSLSRLLSVLVLAPLTLTFLLTFK